MDPHTQRAASGGGAAGLSSALTELSQLLLDTDSFQNLMQQLAHLAARTVPMVKTCGITMANDGRVITVAAADALATQLDEQQYDLEEGPCLQALREGTIIDAPDLTTETRWDGYPQIALSHGVFGVYSSPLQAGAHRTIGALNLYLERPGGLDRQARDLTAHLVTVITVAITATLRNYGDLTLTDQLQAALSSRAVIDQAIGIIIATQRVSPTDAFTALRKQSQNTNTRLAVIAQQLVDAYAQQK